MSGNNTEPLGFCHIPRVCDGRCCQEGCQRRLCSAPRQDDLFYHSRWPLPLCFPVVSQVNRIRWSSGRTAKPVRGDRDPSPDIELWGAGHFVAYASPSRARGEQRERERDEDVHTWLQERSAAPLDREVDPWGSERLLEHLNRMWYGHAVEAEPKRERREHHQASAQIQQAPQQRDTSASRRQARDHALQRQHSQQPHKLSEVLGGQRRGGRIWGGEEGAPWTEKSAQKSGAGVARAPARAMCRCCGFAARAGKSWNSPLRCGTISASAEHDVLAVRPFSCTVSVEAAQAVAGSVFDIQLVRRKGVALHAPASRLRTPSVRCTERGGRRLRYLR